MRRALAVAVASLIVQEKCRCKQSMGLIGEAIMCQDQQVCLTCQQDTPCCRLFVINHSCLLLLSFVVLWPCVCHVHRSVLLTVHPCVRCKALNK